MEVHLVFNQHEILEKPLFWFEGNNNADDSAKALENKLKKIINYKWANRHMLWGNIFGDEFSFQIYLFNDRWEISIWDYKGNTTIGHITQKVIDKEKDILSDENHSLLKKMTENYSRNIIQCTECKKEINRNTEVGGRYFAGVYCQKCWDDKYKAIEARETYN